MPLEPDYCCLVLMFLSDIPLDALQIGEQNVKNAPHLRV